MMMMVSRIKIMKTLIMIVTMPEVLDVQGLYGWEKVDALVRELIGLCGLNVSNEEAKIIQELYSKLDEYDQSPLTFTIPRPTLHEGGLGGVKRVT